ncbi:MAG TPA: sterol desaturase family protein [Flavobacteriaceae bacterium]|nr:sterol desaturase family protein [Flavobacteriaceae bacterium]
MNDLLNQEVLYAWSTPFFAAIILIEIAVSFYLKRKNYDLKDTATNVYFALLNIGLDMIMKVFSFMVLGFFFTHSFVTWENQDWIYWVVVFVLQDFLYYIHHYVDHISRFFWAVHVTHHNSTYYNLTTGFRSPVFQPMYRYVFFIPMALLGMSPIHIMFAYALNQIYGVLCHTNFIKHDLGLWGKIFVTPSHHRVHHAANVKYLDKNMGMVLIIWDKIFGTFQAEETTEKYEKIHFGLTKDLEDKGPVNVIFHEWIAIFKEFRSNSHLSLKTRLKYVFFRPGWSHDGSSKTSKQLQEELKS